MLLFYKLLQGCHSQLVGKLLNCRTITSCWNNINNIVTTLCRQPCNILVISYLYQTCSNSLVTSLIKPSSLLQVNVNSLFQTCCNVTSLLSSVNLVATCQQAGNKQCEHVLLTIASSLLQVCYNLCVFTCVPSIHTNGFSNVISNDYVIIARQDLQSLSGCTSLHRSFPSISQRHKSFPPEQNMESCAFTFTRH
jgi:hypothetical protein